MVCNSNSSLAYKILQKLNDFRLSDINFYHPFPWFSLLQVLGPSVYSSNTEAYLFHGDFEPLSSTWTLFFKMAAWLVPFPSLGVSSKVMASGSLPWQLQPKQDGQGLEESHLIALLILWLRWWEFYQNPKENWCSVVWTCMLKKRGVVVGNWNEASIGSFTY